MRPRPTIQSKAQWRVMLADARRRTDEMLAFDPDRTMLQVIRAQLDFMEQCVQGWLKALDYAFGVTRTSLP